MNTRAVLPPRRSSVTIEFEDTLGMRFVLTYSRFAMSYGGGLAEIFVNTDGKVGSTVDVMVSDGATAMSLALQYGVPVDVLRKALRRNEDGSPMGALGHALDVAAADLRKRAHVPADWR